MSIYAPKQSAFALNDLLKLSGRDLQALAQENSDLHTQRVELMEKQAELKATVSAYKEAISQMQRGKVAPSAVGIKVAEILNLDPAVVLSSETTDSKAASPFESTGTKTSSARTHSRGDSLDSAEDRHARFFAQI